MRDTSPHSQPAYRIIGGTPLRGSVALTGAKNAAGKLLLASLLSSQPSTVRNVPNSGEIDIACSILEHAGAQFERHDHTFTIHPPATPHADLSALPGKNRHPILLLGPLLFRTGRARVPQVSGDRIGARPVNFHLEILSALGATVRETPSSIEAEATRLKAATYTLPFPSVGATETMFLTASWADGTSVLHNGAIEPEVLQLVTFLNSMGAKITQHGRTYHITGVTSFSSGKAAVIPDRLEAVSYASAALATKGSVFLQGAWKDHMGAYLDFLARIGADVQVTATGILVSAPSTALRATNLRTGVYPAFSTDYQQPSVVVLARAEGTSVVHETVYTHRLGYTDALCKMGAQIVVSTTCPTGDPCRFEHENVPHVATVTGPSTFRGDTMKVPDIRAGMAHVIAALAAPGTSHITGVEHLERGYDHLVEKLQGLGASIQRTT